MTVERVDVSRLDATHNRAAELVKRQRQLNDRLDQFFREVAEVRELMRADGSIWDGPVLDPPIEAAFSVWRERGAKETRIEISRLPEPPLMALEPGYPDSPA